MNSRAAGNRRSAFWTRSLAQGFTPCSRPDMPDVEIIEGDIRDDEAVRKGPVRVVDGVFHLAAEVVVGQSMYEIARYTPPRPRHRGCCSRR